MFPWLMMIPRVVVIHRKCLCDVIFDVGEMESIKVVAVVVVVATTTSIEGQERGRTVG